MHNVKKRKGTAASIVVAVALFTLAGMAGSGGRDTLRSHVAEAGMIQLALITPIGADYIDVDIFRGKDASGERVDKVTLAAGVYSVLLPKLLQDTYFITAKAYNGSGQLMYQGSGNASVVSEVTNILTILLNQSVVENNSNRAPRIESFEAFGRTTEGDGDLYVLAPKKNEPVQLTAAVSDDDGDKISVRWKVTDSPSPGGVDVGTILSDSVGPSIIWKHDQEGTYWVNIFAEDGNGGAAAFTFSITVLNNENDLNVRFFFNAFPTVVTSVKNEQASKNRLVRETIVLDAAGSADPDGDRVSYLWTTDCAFAEMTGAATAKKVAIIATKEESCTATVHVFDSLGYNEATVALDICCQDGSKNCVACSPSQQRTRPPKGDFRITSSSTVHDQPNRTRCLEKPSGTVNDDDPVAAGSEASAHGMCRI
jgi:hypothetical protein